MRSVFCAVVLAAAGCAAPVPPAEIDGVVEYDGEPVGVGIVAFMPTEPGGPMSGGAIKNGRYKVYAENGLPPGTYKVEIRWPKPTGNKVKEGYMTVDELAEGLPAKYHDATELTATVVSGPNTVDFRLAK